MAGLTIHDNGDAGMSLTCALDTQVDELVIAAGHEPNGYFWEGIAESLIRTEAPVFEGLYDFDSEGGLFCVVSEHREVLEGIELLMSRTMSEPGRFAEVFLRANEMGIEFDD